MVLDLDDPASLRADVVGRKAARLAAARAARLPTLPGVVVPFTAGEPALARGRAAVRAGRVAAARAETARFLVEPSVVSALRAAVASWEEPLIARSSSPLDDDGAWDGAFATVHGVGVDDLAAALRGCWSSAFTRDVLGRRDVAGIDLDAVRVAVLVQPEVTPDAAGTATRQRDGTVLVTAVAGTALGLLGGWRDGQTARVSPDRRVERQASGDGVLTVEDAAAVADLAHRVHHELGDAAIEWALLDGRVLLLQSRPEHTADHAVAVGSSPETADAPSSGGPASAGCTAADRRLAGAFVELVVSVRGPVGERLILPWALGLIAAGRPLPGWIDDPDGPYDTRDDRTGDLAAAVAALADELTASTWRASVPEARARCDRVVADAQRGRLDRALRAIARLEPPGAAAVDALGGGLVALARRCAATGRLDAPTLLWSADQLDQPRIAPVVARSRAAARWTEALRSIVAAHGCALAGHAGAPGSAVGRGVLVRDPSTPPTLRPGDVVVAARPLPPLAPLLWSAGGLVTTAGDRAAHLLGVARSLGVPAVVACRSARGPDGSDATGFAETLDGVVLAIGGDTGSVAALHKRSA